MNDNIKKELEEAKAKIKYLEYQIDVFMDYVRDKDLDEINDIIDSWDGKKLYNPEDYHFHQG